MALLNPAPETGLNPKAFGGGRFFSRPVNRGKEGGTQGNPKSEIRNPNFARAAVLLLGSGVGAFLGFAFHGLSEAEVRFPEFASLFILERLGEPVR
jgi:hypothetical protein